MQAETDHRRHPRYKLSFPIRLHTAVEDNPPDETITRDISARGVCFELSEEMELGSELRWEMALPPQLCGGQDVRIRCRGKIVRVEKSDAQGKVGVAATIESYEFIRGEESKSKSGESAVTA